MSRGTVLVVDDEPVIVDLVMDLLGDDDYHVQAASGSGALPLARSLRPDVILLDVAMPGMDGVEVGRRLHADPRTAAIPVIAISGHDTLPADAAMMGADDYVAKPFDLDVLTRRVERWTLPVGTPGVERRPSSRDVQAWMARELTPEEFITVVSTLRDDPNWEVRMSPGWPTPRLDLRYYPTGEHLCLTIACGDPMWWRMGQQARMQGTTVSQAGYRRSIESWGRGPEAHDPELHGRRFSDRDKGAALRPLPS